MNNVYDLIIIGGGPAGYSAAIQAGRLGKNVILFEGENVGGTCLNVGCIPSKYLLDKASILDRIRGLTELNIFKEAGQFSFSRIIKEKDNVVNKLTKGVEYLLKESDVTLIKGNAQLVTPGEVLCNGKTYKGEKTLITTGSEPVMPPIEGAAEYTVGSTEVLSLKKVPKRLAVIGGGVIGLELASAYNSFGSKVTIFEKLPAILENEDTDCIKELLKNLKSKGIDIKTDVTVKKISAKSNEKLVHYSDSSQEYEASADVVMMVVGRKPCLKGINPEKIGLKINERGFIYVNEQMQTNLENVYAAGDVIGGWQLAHSAYAEAKGAVNSIFSNKRKKQNPVIPRCVYTHPPYAAAGITKKQAEKKGISYKVGSFPYGVNGLALAEEAPEGKAQVIVDKKTDKILGVQIVGLGAPELIATGTMAITAGLTVDQWADIITAHPSLSEVLYEAVLDSKGISLHSSSKS